MINMGCGTEGGFVISEMPDFDTFVDPNIKTWNLTENLERVENVSTGVCDVQDFWSFLLEQDLLEPAPRGMGAPKANAGNQVATQSKSFHGSRHGCTLFPVRC